MKLLIIIAHTQTNHIESLYFSPEINIDQQIVEKIFTSSDSDKNNNFTIDFTSLLSSYQTLNQLKSLQIRRCQLENLPLDFFEKFIDSWS